MIDYVTLRHHINIPTNYFSPMKWKRSQTEDGQFFRWHTFRRVKLRYYEDTQTFTISGKLLMFLYDTQVQNPDDIYGAKQEMFIEELNDALNHLFPSPILDIRDFTVSRIDYCFNVETPHVKTYVDFMNHAFQMVSTGTRVNFANEHHLSGSVYIRTASDYEDNSNKNYTLNFYDKADQVKDLISKGAYISESDRILAQDVLRLEVQCGYQMIKRLTRKFGISNTFGELLDFRIAYDAICSTYQLTLRGTENADFFTYAEAKERLTGHVKAQDVLRVASSHRITDSKYAYGRNQAKNAGVYPHCFLPKNGSLMSLENPIKLLKDKLMKLKAL